MENKAFVKEGYRIRFEYVLAKLASKETARITDKDPLYS